jgi:hypothetical protein
MDTTNTGGDAFAIARTALEGCFGVLRVLARKGLLEQGDLGEMRAAFAVEAANMDPADRRNLNEHVETRFVELRRMAQAASNRTDQRG